MDHTPRYVAQLYVASSPKAEMLGISLMSFLDNLQIDDIRPFLENYKLKQIDPDKWYPQQLVLDFNRAIVESRINAMDSLVAMGMKIIDTMPFDPNIKTLEQAVAILSSPQMRQVIRNVPEEEGIITSECRPGYILVIDNTPYPADLIYGYLWAIARRYKPASATFTVQKVENPNPAQNPGKAFEIRWN